MTVFERFRQKVKITEGCWEWQANKMPAGYGRFGVRHGVHVFSHRWIWEFIHGPIPTGLLVCHHCDNPSCVNPAHLFLGTHGDNVRDGMNKKRYPTGQNSYLAKFSDEQVVEMRELYRGGGISLRQLAQRYGACRSVIFAIISNRHYRNVPCP